MQTGAPDFIEILPLFSQIGTLAKEVKQRLERVMRALD
jgi:hypothetical protein